MAGFGLSIRREESVHNHVTPVFTQFPCCQPDWRPWTTKLTRRRCERSWDVTVATANVRIESAKNLRRFRVVCLSNLAALCVSSIFQTSAKTIGAGSWGQHMVDADRSRAVEKSDGACTKTPSRLSRATNGLSLVDGKIRQVARNNTNQQALRGSSANCKVVLAE